VGMQFGWGNNDLSQKYGTQFTVVTATGKGFKTTIGNRASYAPFLSGAKQAAFMAAKGWRKLFDVAEKKTPKLTEILQAYINRAITKLGLR